MPEIKDKTYIFVGFKPIDRNVDRNFAVDGVFDFVCSGKDFLFKPEIELIEYHTGIADELKINASKIISEIDSFFKEGNVKGLISFMKQIRGMLKFNLNTRLVFGREPVESIIIQFREDAIRSGDFIEKIGFVKEKDLKTHIIHGTLGIWGETSEYDEQILLQVWTWQILYY